MQRGTVQSVLTTERLELICVKSMSFKHWIIVGAGVIGILLVVLFPRWFYPAQRLMPQERTIGNRLIIKKPPSIPITMVRSGHIVIDIGQRIEARIDYPDLSLRVGFILAVVICGLLMLNRTK